MASNWYAGASAKALAAGNQMYHSSALHGHARFGTTYTNEVHQITRIPVTSKGPGTPNQGSTRAQAIAVAVG